MKKIIIHFVNKCDELIVFMIISRLLTQEREHMKDGRSRMCDHNDYRIEFAERKTCITFYATNLNK